MSLTRDTCVRQTQVTWSNRRDLCFRAVLSKAMVALCKIKTFTGIGNFRILAAQTRNSFVYENNTSILCNACWATVYVLAVIKFAMDSNFDDVQIIAQLLRKQYCKVRERILSGAIKTYFLNSMKITFNLCYMYTSCCNITRRIFLNSFWNLVVTRRRNVNNMSNMHFPDQVYVFDYVIRFLYYFSVFFFLISCVTYSYGHWYFIIMLFNSCFRYTTLEIQTFSNFQLALEILILYIFFKSSIIFMFELPDFKKSLVYLTCLSMSILTRITLSSVIPSRTKLED